MPRDYKLYLEDILAAIVRINIYTQSIDFDTFHNDSQKVDAVLYNLEVIGEAAKNVPLDLRNAYSNIEWRKIAGLRDIIVHEYFGVSLEIVWDVIQNKLPDLSRQIIEILKKAE